MSVLLLASDIAVIVVYAYESTALRSIEALVSDVGLRRGSPVVWAKPPPAK